MARYDGAAATGGGVSRCRGPLLFYQSHLRPVDTGGCVYLGAGDGKMLEARRGVLAAALPQLLGACKWGRYEMG
ncbi:hypothetical protein P3T76_008038 [Phytophthora citrophthora]|uniref:Uncharacterized protein n=1 Tax=Phytophthora citrophthora TaxID=4793 RepID=A0AAD9GLD5_9STRA|nr:hypothetical protein P3T76_008038 [Phytophthora citrophthora]